jgi:hypothetical protein
MHCRRHNSISGQVLVLLIILLAILGGGFWYMNQSKQANEKAARDFAQEAATRILVRQDERFLDFALSPEARVTYPPSWRYRLFSQIRELGVREQKVEVYGEVGFTSGFFEPRGNFRVKINAAENPAYLDLIVAHPRALWEIDVINFTWTPHVEATPPPATPGPSLTPTPSPTPQETKETKKKRATPT